MEETKTMEAPQAAAIGAEQVKKLTAVLQKYKTGKVRTEHRIIASENWWKLRNDAEEGGDSLTMAKEGFKSASGWLHNVIVSKHADAMEAYPEPNILPREEDDRAEAHILTASSPVCWSRTSLKRRIPTWRGRRSRAAQAYTRWCGTPASSTGWATSPSAR